MVTRLHLQSRTSVPFKTPKQTDPMHGTHVQTITTVLLYSLFTIVHIQAFTAPLITACIDRPLATLHNKPRHPPLGERWPCDIFTRQDAKNERRLMGRVSRLETLVHELCSAIVYSDDMALMEREMLQAGAVHMDLSSNLTRQPVLLRRVVSDIARKHGQPASPPAHNWH